MRALDLGGVRVVHRLLTIGCTRPVQGTQSTPAARMSVFDVQAVRRPPSEVAAGGSAHALYQAQIIRSGLEQLIEFYTASNETTLVAQTQQQLEQHEALIETLLQDVCPIELYRVP
jgi:hypothetical protein